MSITCTAQITTSDRPSDEVIEGAPPSPEIGPSQAVALSDRLEQDVTSLEDSQHHYPPREIPALPRPDRGRDAMLFLSAAFTVETIVWGFPSSYGVLLAHYQTHGVNGDRSASSLLPLVGTFAGGLMYLLGPVISLVLNPRPRWRPWAIRSGAVICCIGILTSSFASKPWQLLLTQGLLYSIGGSLCYYPTFSYLSEWFVERRGFANGVCFAGTASGGLVYPFIMNALIARYGAAVMLRSLAVASALLLASALPRLKPRLRLSAHSFTRLHDLRNRDPADNQSVRKKLWKSKRLVIFLLANFAQAIGYFTPTLYLPSFAESIGLSGAQGSAMLACVNATAVISRVSIGILSDRMQPHLIGACTLSAATVAILVLWGFSTSFAPLLAFSLALGLAAGGWTSLYSRVIFEAAKDDLRLASTLFGLISFTRGLGSVLTAPISSFLITYPLQHAEPFTAYGVAQGKYGSMVICVGVAMAVAAGIETGLSLPKRMGSAQS